MSTEGGLQEAKFKRPPSGFEIEYARNHGWSGLAERTQTRAGNQKTGRSKMGRKRQADSRDEGSSDVTSSSEDSEDSSNDEESNSDSGATSSGGRERHSSSESGGCGIR